MAENSNYKKGIGRLVVDRYDFQRHIDGTDFQHNAIGINLSTPLTSLGNATNVQTAFDNLNTYIGLQSSAGQGLITVGDGYDTWHAADGNINFDNTIPALNLILKPAFDAIINGTTIPAQFQRVANGGIVVIKAGTYIVTDTINIPAGITLMGEGWGTKIVNATALDLTVTPPTVNNALTPKSIFCAKLTLTRSTNDAAIDPSLFMFSRQTKICNMVIGDNFIENTILGDTAYKLPQNKSGNIPLIIQESGSNLFLDNVMLIGRVSFSTGKVVSAATKFAIQLDTSTGITTGTFLQLNECFIDGFSQPINYMATGGTRDFLEITNSRIRAHGYLSGSGTNINENCIVAENGCNTTMIGNHFFGNHINARTILYIDGFDASAVDVQSRSKINISSNNIVIDKGSSGFPALQVAYVNPSVLATYYVKAAIQTFGNNYQPDYGFEISSSLRVKTNTVSGSYTIDSMDGDNVILVDTTTIPAVITLPRPIPGRHLIIKDAFGNAQNNNITFVRFGGTGTIDGYAGSRILATNYASWTLINDGVNWYIV